jgi:hypothetical protein
LIPSALTIVNYKIVLDYFIITIGITSILSTYNEIKKREKATPISIREEKHNALSIGDRE